MSMTRMVSLTTTTHRTLVSGFKGIPRNMTGIAEKLREAGYATHQVGKWHAGAATPDHISTG